MESLSDRLKSLGMHLGMNQTNKITARENSLSFEAVLDLQKNVNLYGENYYHHEIIDSDYQHGIINFSDEPDLHSLNLWSKISDGKTFSKESVVFLDCETTGLSGGTGTIPFLIGLGFWKDQQFHLYQLFLHQPNAELALLTFLSEVLTPFQVVITFNGKSFDIPLLHTRFVLNFMEDVFSNWGHVDMLHFARRLWRLRLSSRSLGSIEKEILKITRTDDEIPGWMVPEMYVDYLRSGDPNPLKGVFYHNKMDIVSLAALFIHAGKIMTNPIQWLDDSLDVISAGRLFEELGQVDTSLSLYKAAINQGLPLPFYLDTLKRYANIYRKQQNWFRAVQLWVMAAENDDVDSCVSLAKYYEHREKDYASALHYTEMAIRCCVDSAEVQRLKKRLHRLLLLSGFAK